MNTLIVSDLPHKELRKSFYVYVYFESPTKPIYVGKGVGNRANSHYKGRSHATGVTHAMAQADNPSVKIIHVETEKEAYSLESFLIEEIGRKNVHTGPLLNERLGGGGRSKKIKYPFWKFTAEHRAKLSKAAKERELRKQLR